MNMRELVREIMGLLAGEASMCWSLCPTGVFDSTSASKAVDQATDKIMEIVNKELDFQMLDREVVIDLQAEIKQYREALEKISWFNDEKCPQMIRAIATRALQQGGSK